MIQSIKSYLKYIWHSKNEHGVHSPFVFNLVTQCFYDKKHYLEYESLKSHRKLLIESKSSIEVMDFGVGSKVFKSNKRAINQIAKNAGISTKRAELLFRIVNYFKPEYILEIGTSVGLATAALSLGYKNTKVYSLEGCQKTADVAKTLFQHCGFFNIRVETVEFSDYLKKRTLPNSNFQLIYFDGNHSKPATLEYFELLLPTTTNDTVWIFDDIHWSPEMEEAWKILKEHPQVTVTIDTFQWGFVFFRKEQPKEHFVIRI